MAVIVGIQFQKNGKTYNYDTNGFDLKPEDYVICDTPHGTDLGQVVVGCRQIDMQDTDVPLKKVIRIASERDLQVCSDNRSKEKEAFAICQKKIAEHKLDMKLVSVEYAFDNSKAMFYFTANGRVDFRSLVKDLASVFKMRIELRQIGVRDEARMIGGLGPCGRQICCGAFLDEFQPVSIKMAKEQNLSLNPTKISGVCGRLMCCLKYEQEHYEQTRKIMPKVGKEVITPDGAGIVSDLNIVKETVFVRIANGDSSEIREYPLEKIEKSGSPVSQQPCIQRERPDGKEGITEQKESAETGAPEPRTEKSKNSEDALQKQDEKGSRDAKSRKGDRNQNRNREPQRSERQDRLGKPVMRENPNRNTQPARENEAAVNGTVQTVSENAKPASSWAEAVQKAMDSIS